MAVPMTKKGYEALKAELDRLRKVDRPQNIQDIAEAREHGDLRENAEFKAAKERQQFIDTRMSELEYKLGDAQVIESGTGPAKPWCSAPPSDSWTSNRKNRKPMPSSARKKPISKTARFPCNLPLDAG